MQKELPPIFERTDINTLPLSDTHEKGLCFQYLWELLFLRLTPIFAPLLTDTLSRRPFLRWTVSVCRCVCHISANIASARNKGLGLSQQAKTDTARQGADLDVFRECGHTLYACSDSVPLRALLKINNNQRGETRQDNHVGRRSERQIE